MVIVTIVAADDDGDDHDGKHDDDHNGDDDDDDDDDHDHDWLWHDDDVVGMTQQMPQEGRIQVNMATCQETAFQVDLVYAKF